MLEQVDISGGAEASDAATASIDSFLTEEEMAAAAAEAEAAGLPPLPPPDERIWSQLLADKLKPLVDTKVGQLYVKAYEKVGVEVFGGPSVEKIGQEITEVLSVHAKDGIVAATKVGTAKSFEHSMAATVHTLDKTKTYASEKATATKAFATETAGATKAYATEKALAAATAASEARTALSKRVMDNPNVESVVGAAIDASIGVGSMVTTVTSTAKTRAAALAGYTPEAAALAEAEAEAWRQVLTGDGIGGSAARGEVMAVPARTTHTSTFFVKMGELLSWRFRVASHDIGFALRLRVQGDGGATEVDVFGMEK